MLHLAQVQNNESVGAVELKLLARQHSENSWVVINPENIPLTTTNSLNPDLLVLVELSEDKEVMSIQQAKEWVLDLIQQYLTTGVSPKFLQEEAERTEQWRQDLTQRSQDLTRQRLEMEARREQIQTLEEDLRQDKQQLEETAAQLKAKEEDLERERQQLNAMIAQLNHQGD
jgi:DNA repair exonuclease SbcCD ATPase subunit